MVPSRHYEEVVAEIATRIYCTRLSLGEHNIDVTCVAEDAFAIYRSCVSCIAQAEKAK